MYLRSSSYRQCDVKLASATSCWRVKTRHTNNIFVIRWIFSPTGFHNIVTVIIFVEKSICCLLTVWLLTCSFYDLRTLQIDLISCIAFDDASEHNKESTISHIRFCSFFTFRYNFCILVFIDAAFILFLPSVLLLFLFIAIFCER